MICFLAELGTATEYIWPLILCCYGRSYAGVLPSQLMSLGLTASCPVNQKEFDTVQVIEKKPYKAIFNMKNRVLTSTTHMIRYEVSLIPNMMLTVQSSLTSTNIRV